MVPPIARGLNRCICARLGYPERGAPDFQLGDDVVAVAHNSGWMLVMYSKLCHPHRWMIRNRSPPRFTVNG